MEFETEASQPAVMSAIVITKSDRNERGPDEDPVLSEEMGSPRRKKFPLLGSAHFKIHS